MKQNSILNLSLLMLLITSSCNNSDNNSKVDNLPDPLVTNRDTTVDPGEDFFHYANGGWFKAHPIPESERANGIFRMIGDTINSQVKQVCEQAALANADKGSNKQKIGDFYASGMDTASIEKAGISVLNNEIAKIDSVVDLPSLMKSISRLHKIGASPAFQFYIGQDDKISTKYAIIMMQGGLGLGDREYYFKTDSASVEIRKEYVKHISSMFTLAGSDEVKSATNAATVISIETELAKNCRKMEDVRDPIKNYNKLSINEFNKLIPKVDVKNWFSSMDLASADTVIVGQPEFYKALGNMLYTVSINDWKIYLKWNLLNAYSDYLSSTFDKQNFHFFSTVLNGVKEQKPRWKRVVEQTNNSLGELIGQVYIEEYLPKGTKEKLLEIGNNIRDVYAERIKNLDWMSEATKAKALKKLDKIVMKVGYPDKWKDMSSVSIDRNSYALNVMAVSEWEYNYEVSKFGKAVDRGEWQMFPQTYNAYYNPSNNEIVVPACNIIVPGFEGRMPDDAILYGIIGGSTFGHEITHGFDDQGSQYDENGNLSDWWTAEDKSRFLAKTKLIVAQYSSYKIDSLHINGDATQGENIADLGGVVMGYEAFKKTNQFKNNQIISGLTPNQRYFLAYGYAWMINSRPKSIARQIMTDVHSPAQYRINGPLSNIPQFYKTFEIKEGDKMWRPDSLRVIIW